MVIQRFFYSVILLTSFHLLFSPIKVSIRFYFSQLIPLIELVSVAYLRWKAICLLPSYIIDRSLIV